MGRIRFSSCVFAILCLSVVAGPSAVAAWSPPQNLSADADPTAWPDIAVGPDGALHAVWTNQSTRQMNYSQRPPGGSWSAPVVVGSYAGTTPFADGDIAVAVASDGTVHIVYADDSSGNSDIYHRSKPPGGAWSAAENISQTAGTRSEFLDVAVTPNGTVHAAWIDVTPTGGICCSETYYAGKAVGGAWSAPINISNNSINEYEIRIGVGPDNSVHILTAQEDGGPGAQDIYHYAKPFGGAFGAPDNLTNNPNMGRNMGGVVQTADGTVHVVYYEGNPSEVIYWSRPPCGSWTGPLNLSNSSSSSGNPTIVADACGTVHVAWVDDASGGTVFYTGLPPNGSWSTPAGVTAAPGTGRVQLAAAGASGLTTGTVELIYHAAPGGVSDAFFTEASLGACDAVPVTVSVDPGDRSGGSVPGALRIVPNPSPGRVRFEAALATAASLRIFDMAGRLQREIELAPTPSGMVAGEWDGRDARGLETPAGVYWARIGGSGPGHGSPVVLVR